MITQKPAFITADGKAFVTKVEAESHSIDGIIGAHFEGEIRTWVTRLILEKRNELVAILTGKPVPKPRGPYKRKAKVQTPDLPLENTAK